METQFEFEIQSLLIAKDGTISGPMSTLLFFLFMGDGPEKSFNRLARITFGQKNLLQIYDDEVLSRFDHFIVGVQLDDNLKMYMWVDMGRKGLCVAKYDYSNRQTEVLPDYEQAEFAGKLSEDQIREIFEFIFLHPDAIAIRKE